MDINGIQSWLQLNMSSLPTGCCAVQWAMWKGGGLTCRDRLISSENYLLLGFLLAMQSHTVLLLVRQSVTQDNCSISVSYPSSSKLKWWKNLSPLETEISLLKRVELGQETIQSRNKVLLFILNYGDHPKLTNTRSSMSQQQYPHKVSCSQHLAG